MGKITFLKRIIRACFKWLYFPFWGIISFIFLNLGFDALDRTGLSESVPPIIMFLFKHAFAISVIYSSEHGLVQCKDTEHQIYYHLLFFVFFYLPLLLVNFVFASEEWSSMRSRDVFLFVVLVGLGAKMSLCVSSLVSRCTFRKWICCVIDFMMKACLLARGHSREFIPALALLISCIISCITAAVLEIRSEYKVLPLQENKSGNNVSSLPESKSSNKKWKLIEFAIGTVGSALFQYFFRLTSFHHVLAFLYLSVAWLGNIALVRSTSDFGIFNFLLGNVIVSAAVDESGLGGNTWIMYGASVFLYAVRLLVT